MTVLDIVLLSVTGVLVIVSFCRGFVRTLMGLGTAILAMVAARLVGGAIGRELFPQLLTRKSPIAVGMSSAKIERLNTSIATVLGTLAAFIVFYLIFKLILKLISHRLDDRSTSGIIDKLFGAALGLVMALGAIYAFACLIDVIAIVLALFGSSWDIYDAVESSVILEFLF